MKKTPSRSLIYFFVASLFATTAQSFLLVPHQQQALLDWGIPVWQTVFAISLLLLSYASLALAFYQHQPAVRKLVALGAVLALAFLIFLYVRAAFYLEALPLFLVAGLIFLLLVSVPLESDWLGKFATGINILAGSFLLFPQIFFQGGAYDHARSLLTFFSALFLGTALIKWVANRKPESDFAYYATRLLSFPWIGWALFFSVQASLAQLIPPVLFSFALLSCGLLPFEKFRLPDNQILGNSIYPLLLFLFSVLLAVFVLLTKNIPTTYPTADILFIFSITLGILLVYGVMRLHYLISELAQHSRRTDDERQKGKGFIKLVELLFAPFRELQPLSEWQAKKIQRLSGQLLVERENNKRVDMIRLLHDQLDEFEDDSTSAQLVVHTIAQYFKADLAAILLNDIDARELELFAIDGTLKAYVPANYRQSIDMGTLGRAARLQKLQIVNDTSADRDYFNLKGETIESEVFVPLLQYGNLKGVLMVGVKKKGAFSAADIRILEAAVKELLKTWERASHSRRMRALIQSSVSLSTSLEPHSAVEAIAKVTQDTLLARFIFVTLLDQDGTFTRVSSVGSAPQLYEYLSQDLQDNVLLNIALTQKEPLRIRDIRRYKNLPEVPLDTEILRGVMMVPIRLHGVNIGAIIAFGKQDAIFFSEKDESLASLLSTQAAVAVESSWLIQEIRSNASVTNLLYNLSIEIIQTDTMREAARLIAETAQNLTRSTSVGIILFSLDRKVETALELGIDGELATGRTIPIQFVEQTLISGETITISTKKDTAVTYLPIQTSLRKYGVLWIEFYDSERQAAAHTQTLKTLANQAAMALERAMLLLDLRRKAEELKDALDELQSTYDQTLSALMAALDARDRETEGHSTRVGNIACRIGREIGLAADQIAVLRRGALLHDIGKIGVSDNILHKPGPLTNDEWRIMRQHPEIGARIVRDIPFLAETMPVIRYHHERWNGSGYPLGLEAEEIPITARIFAVADVFDALTSIRPYRKTSSEEEAFSYLRENSGILFDPQIVDVFEKLLKAEEVERLMRS